VAGDIALAPGAHASFGGAARRLLLLFGVALLLAFPFLGLGTFTVTLMTEGLILGIWAMSLDLLVGYTGLVSFGHTAGFGLGAYVAGYFAAHVSSEFLLVVAVVQAAAAPVAVLTGFVATRLSGVAFAILTLAVSQVLLQIGVSWVPVTGGMDGLIGVPLPKFFGRTVASGQAFYLITAMLLIVVYLALERVVASPFGQTLRAIRLSEQRAAAIGINVHLHKLAAFVISWLVAGLAGTLLVFMKGGTTPMVFYWHESGYVLAVTIFGGLGTLLGPAIGGIIITFLHDQVSTLFKAWQFAFGLAFVIAVVFLPTGLAGLAIRIWNRLWNTRF
jgi:branched-chain amino acid transport system permease protein